MALWKLSSSQGLTHAQPIISEQGHTHSHEMRNAALGLTRQVAGKGMAARNESCPTAPAFLDAEAHLPSACDDSAESFTGFPFAR